MVPPTQFSPRICALIAGIFGIAVSIVIFALYSIFLVLGPVTSQTDSTITFALELGIILLAAVGSCLILVKAPLGAVFLVVAVLGSILVMGWLALLTAPLWLLAAFLPRFDRGRSEQPDSWLEELESWRNPTTV
jgi:hypothetical protein